MFDPLDLDLNLWSQSPFQSQAHMMQAMRHSQYRSNPEYRQAVEAKVGLESGNLGVTATVYDNTERSGGELPTARSEKSERQQRADERSADERALAEQQGEMSVRPEARRQIQTEARSEVIGTHRATVSTQ